MDIRESVYKLISDPSFFFDRQKWSHGETVVEGTGHVLEFYEETTGGRSSYLSDEKTNMFRRQHQCPGQAVSKFIQLFGYFSYLLSILLQVDILFFWRDEYFNYDFPLH